MRDAYCPFHQHVLASWGFRTAAIYTSIAESFDCFRGSRAQPSPHDLDRFLARPRHDGAQRAPAGRNQILTALRAHAKFNVSRGHWAQDPTAGMKFARVPASHPAVLSVGEVRTLFEVVAKHSRSAERDRNLGILAVLGTLGLRVSEVAALDEDQVDVLSGALLAVKGKGGTVVDMPLNASTLALLRAHLASRTAVLGEHALFLGPTGTRLSVRTIERLLERARVWMGTQKKVTPHTLRHSMATNLIILGIDLPTTSQTMRHASVSTTMKYIHLADTVRRTAITRLQVVIPTHLVTRVEESKKTTLPNQPESPASFASRDVDANGDLCDAA